MAAILVKEMLAASGFVLVDQRLRTGRTVVLLRALEVRSTFEALRENPIVKVHARPERELTEAAAVLDRVRYAELSFSEVGAVLRAHTSLGRDRGVLVHTPRDSQASSGTLPALLRQFDVITRVGRRSVKSPAELVHELRVHHGKRYTVELLRHGKSMIVIVER